MHVARVWWWVYYGDGGDDDNDGDDDDDDDAYDSFDFVFRWSFNDDGTIGNFVELRWSLVVILCYFQEIQPSLKDSERSTSRQAPSLRARESLFMAVTCSEKGDRKPKVDFCSAFAVKTSHSGQSDFGVQKLETPTSFSNWNQPFLDNWDDHIQYPWSKSIKIKTVYFLFTVEPWLPKKNIKNNFKKET